MFRSLVTAIWCLLCCASAWATSCTQPTEKCLIQHIKSQADELKTLAGGLSPQLVLNLQFELKKNTSPGSSANNPLLEQLLSEEKIIQLLKSGDLESAYVSAKSYPQLFHDSLQAKGAFLVIQHLTLNLNDNQAEQIKREQLEANWKKGVTPNDILMELARHEILGGNPTKGTQTLNNTQINEFSELDLINENSIITQLGKIGEEWFLDPTAATKSCQQNPANALTSIQHYFSTAHLKLTDSLWNTPNIQQAWRAQLALIILYQNAGACSLLVSLHTNQLIHSALQLQAKTEQDLLDLIYLLRALRRYSITALS